MKLLTLVMVFFLSLPVSEAKEASGKAKRKPANNNSPAKVLTFQCKDADSDELAAIGIAHMSLDLRDTSIGTFSMSFYWKSGKTFLSKTLMGTFTTVPEGFVYRTQWGATSPYTLIHIHPADKTTIPVKKEKLQCEGAASLDSYP